MKNATRIENELFKKFDVKRGLRNEDGTGVLVGLTKIGNVVGSVSYTHLGSVCVSAPRTLVPWRGISGERASEGGYAYFPRKYGRYLCR